MKLLYSISFLFLLPLLAKSQTNESGTLTAEVFMNETETAPFATVMLYDIAGTNLEKADATDESGTLKMQGVPPGEYSMLVTYVGYDDYNHGIVTIKANETTRIGKLVLAASAESLDEVTVTAQRPMVEIKPDKTVFNVAGSINAQGGNALELLRKAPGVMLDNNDNIMLLGKSGVAVYIDGKPSPLSADDLANYLESLTADAIDNIEVITNPSSKFEAEGNAGIINIVLKKSDKVGTNVSMNTSLDIWNRYANYGLGLQINHRTSKTNIYGGYNFGHAENKEEINIKRINGPLNFDQRAQTENERDGHTVKLGFDYFINKKSTIGVLINGGLVDVIDNGNSRSHMSLFDGNQQRDSVLVAQNNIDGERDNLSVNLNYSLKGSGDKKLNIDLDYGTFNSLSPSYQPNTYYNLDQSEILRSVRYQSDANTKIDIYSIKVDAEQPLFNGQFSYGIKGALTKTDNDYDFYNLADDDTKTIDLSRTNQFLYDEQVAAAYVNYQRSLNKKWSIQLGLRSEYTDSKGDLVSIDGESIQTNQRDYLDFFPSGGVTYAHDEKNSFRVTYSRRLNRPNYQDLNPFEFRLDELSYRRGNPFLNPEYTNNFQLGHTYNYSLNTTLSYSRKTDLITRLTDTEDSRQSFLTFENLSLQHAASLSVSYPYSPTKWWSTYVNATGNYIKNKSTAGDGRFSEDKSIDIDATFVSVFAQNTFTLPKGVRLELSGFYNSPGLWGGNFETDHYWNVDIGAQKKFLDDKLSIRIGISDIFWGQQWEGSNNFGTLRIDANGRNQSRRIKLNVGYFFGNEKVKSRKRKTGLEEERRRTSQS